MAAPGDWTTDFFTGAWLDVQRAMHSPEVSAAQAEQIAELLELDEGDRVLDAPCGEGRISLALAERGIETVGVDLCQPLLDEARAAAAARGVDARFEALDLREVHQLFGAQDDPFDAAVCIWGSFGYFGDGGPHGQPVPGGNDLDFARAVATVLRPGGHFVIDCPGIERVMDRYQSRGWWAGGGMRVMEDRAWDPLEGVMHVEWTLVRDGEGPDGSGPTQVAIHHSRMRLYSAPELARLLVAAGFRGVDLCGDLSGAAWSPGDRMVMVGTR